MEGSFVLPVVRMSDTVRLPVFSSNPRLLDLPVASIKRYITLLGASAFGMLALSDRHINWSTIRYTGIGQPVGNNLLSMNKSILATVVIANTPQFILSHIYVLMNSVYTCMVTSHEWAKFARHRKTLRVSSPTGQRQIALLTPGPIMAEVVEQKEKYAEFDKRIQLFSHTYDTLISLGKGLAEVGTPLSKFDYPSHKS